MSQRIRFTGNSRTYGIDIDGERVLFSEIKIDPSILSVSSEVSLSGGNLVVEIPETVSWELESDNDTCYLKTKD